MLTSPKLIDPLQIALGMGPLFPLCPLVKLIPARS